MLSIEEFIVTVFYYTDDYLKEISNGQKIRSRGFDPSPVIVKLSQWRLSRSSSELIQTKEFGSILNAIGYIYSLESNPVQLSSGRPQPLVLEAEVAEKICQKTRSL